MYGTILIPTDGSDASNAALDHGIDLAQKYDSTVHLLYVVDEDVYGHYADTDAFDGAEAALAAIGDEVLAAARNRVESASLPVETHVEHTTPHEGIVDAVRRVGADLVVMGTETRSDEYRNLLGSVTERVLRASPVPVHVVKAPPSAGDGVTIRAAREADAEEVQSVARRSMAASYNTILSETAISNAVDRWYETETFEDLLADPEAAVLVAERDGAVVGFSQSHLVDSVAGTTGEIHWLHVDPDHRGSDIGTRLFDRTQAELSDRGVDRIRALVLSDYGPGNEFYRTHDFAKVGARPVQLGGDSVEESVYAPAGDADDWPHPKVEERTTPDGESVFVDYEETEIGSEAPFFAAYTSAELDRRHGWFCSNCETVDNAMDAMGRIVCNQCGNKHKATRWDAVATG